MFEVTTGGFFGVAFGCALIFCARRMRDIESVKGNIAASKFIRQQGAMLLGGIVIVALIVLEETTSLTVVGISSLLLGFLSTILIYAVSVKLRPED